MPPEKREEILNELRQVLWKWSTVKHLSCYTIQLHQNSWQKIWIEVNDLSSGQYSVNKNIIIKTSLLRSDLCDYSDVYIAVKERITVEGDNTYQKSITDL